MAEMIEIVDMFSGSGGASWGIWQAAIALGIADRVRITAINHWDKAIEAHASNFPAQHVRHYCQHVELLNPRLIFPQGRARIMLAAPECIYHSNARGGGECDEQSRSSAWNIVHWAERLYIDFIVIENVIEFLKWGPLGADRKPIKKKRGQLFVSFVKNMEALGYRVQWRVLNSADYGAHTLRRRVFLFCQRGNRKTIQWPEITHTENPQDGLFSAFEPWRAGAEVIDFTKVGTSVLYGDTHRVPNTLERIEKGLRRFGTQPFLTKWYKTSHSASLSSPLPTIVASTDHIGLLEPFIINYKGKNGTRPVTRPLPTFTTQQSIALCQPSKVSSLDRPLAYSEAELREYPLLWKIAQERKFDLRHRYLGLDELKVGQGFPKEYILKGTKEDQVAQIGNAWEGHLSYALGKCALKGIVL